MTRDERLLLVGAGVLAGFTAGEVVGAVLAGSLALLADAGHMLTDVLALAASALVSRIARAPARGHWTFGWARTEVLSAAANGITLLVIAALVTAEAIRRLLHPPGVAGSTLIVVAVIGLAVNAVVLVIIGRTERRSLNVAGAIAHVLTDGYAFAATIIAGAIVVGAGWRRADPVASLVVVALVLRAAVRLLRESGRVLLEAAPTEVDVELVRRHLLETEHVVDIHDLHVWTVTSGLPALSVHVVIAPECFTEGRAPRLLDELQSCLTGHFDVQHSTFQFESVGHLDHEAPTH
ncbi:MAG TPA: cation diffusion facilitator family transporter [Mycobacteriales bacterium]|nr:cation diffusion facilitator family transporter [Mycobacteriales bacterium]